VNRSRSDAARGIEAATTGGLAVLAIALRTIGLTAPWGADNLGTAGAFFSIAARNYLRYGYLGHRLIPVVTAEGPPSPAVLYAHHPPLVPLLVSAAFAVFGEHEWAARLVPLAASLISLALLTHLARRTFGTRVALLTLAVAATLPLDAHLAPHVDVQGSVVLACVLGCLVCVQRGWRLAGLSCFVLGVGADWAALYLPAVLACVWPFERARSRRFLIGWLVLAAALFGVVASWLSSPGEVLELIRTRAISFRSDQGQPFDLSSAVGLIVGTYLWALCTPGVLAMVVVWIVGYLAGPRRDPERLALVLLLFGTIHMVVGFQGARQHEFWTHYLRPGVPLVCALMIDRWSRVTVWQRTATALLLAAVMLPGAIGTVRLARHSLSARMTDVAYTPADLARVIRSCAPPGTGALTSDYFGESATFYYADRPLGIAVLTPAALDDRLARPRYDPPGGAGPSYDLPSLPPRCFVMPAAHEADFPALAATLRQRFAVTHVGPFLIFALPG
jgi:4-amino-4-deoxy-L-arabinose transferase-like glycosyltransferase